MTNNMELWDKVCITDPDHTRHVNTRGGFTAIDAMYQIQCATEQFGAAGKGWGWCFDAPIFTPNDTVVIKCTIWHGDRSNQIEQYGQKSLNVFDKKNKKMVADEDAFKKAATDGLTKCLSYLGFNADVFLGKFDDNKYVESIKTAKQAKEESTKLLDGLDNVKSLDDLAGLWKDYKGLLAHLKVANSALYDEISARKDELKEGFERMEKEEQSKAVYDTP